MAGEHVILLDEQDQPAGMLEKYAAHTFDTPLHLAFSCWLFNQQGQLLVTRRSLGKKAWPGVWTNSCCGHPRPGESPRDAVVRRVGDELGQVPTDLRLALASFSYRAVDAGGTVENELCPVWVGRVDPAGLAPDPTEVMDVAWVAWPTLVRTVAEAPQLLSPWAVLQVPLLASVLAAEEGAA